MACRKAAYRAMTELSEWMEKQQEEADAKLAAIEEEQRQVWTPSEIFDACCTQWLAYGSEILGVKDGLSRGCSGVCGKAHPRITLDFHSNQATSVLSHELDPFVRYFDALVDQGLAKKQSSNCYHLNGFLQDHAERIKRSTPFPSHLVKVSSRALSASQRAHERYMQQQEIEREAKRCRIQGRASDKYLLESVLEVCYNHSFMDHLDLAEIAWMRLSCKTMAKVAARMASSRLKQVRLSYSVLLDGRLGFYPHNDTDDEGFIFSPQHSWQKYDVAGSHMPLSLSCNESNTSAVTNKNLGNGRFIPRERKDFECRIISRARDPGFGYCGHIVRVYLEGILLDQFTNMLPEKDVLFSNPLEVARYPIDRYLQDGDYTSNNLSYKVTLSDDISTENLANNNDPSTPSSQGRLFVKAIQFEFRDLLGIYVRKKLPQAKKKMLEIKRKRPLSRMEKDYVKALAKEAREAPGSATAFQGMKGW